MRTSDSPNRYRDKSKPFSNMKTWNCDCGNRIYFENTRCQQCGNSVGFYADQVTPLSIRPAADGQLISPTKGMAFKQCVHHTTVRACNWLLAAEDPNTECLACRLNDPVCANIYLPPERIFKLESAKRRLIYSLLDLGLPVLSKFDDPIQGISFQFLGTASGDGESNELVVTGHQQGKITINADEAEDSVLEKLRIRFGEPYRTLLGHFRHESGHFYWDRLIAQSPQEGQFINLFGDASVDYQASLNRFYSLGAPDQWQQNYISAYASSHPWEDWAETWAHYLHMMDTLETAIDHGFIQQLSLTRLFSYDMDRLIAEWTAIVPVINDLARSLGSKDVYPFVIYPAVVEKLRFIHAVIQQQARQNHRPNLKLCGVPSPT